MWAQGDLYRSRNKPIQPVNSPILAIKPRQVSFKPDETSRNEMSMNSLNDTNEDEDIENENVIENDENYESLISAHQEKQQRTASSSRVKGKASATNSKVNSNGYGKVIAPSATYKNNNGALTESTFSNEISVNLNVNISFYVLLLNKCLFLL
jgi:hypothetical protein